MPTRLRPWGAAALLPAALFLAPLGPRARAVAQPGRWVAGADAGVDFGVITNPRFVSANDSTDVLWRARVGGTLARRGDRWTVSGSASGDHQRFRITPGLTQFTYGASADVAGNVTPRLRARAGASARTLLTRGVLLGGALPPAIGAPPAEAPVDPSVPEPPSTVPPGVGTPGGSGPGLPLLPLVRTNSYGGTAGLEYLVNPRTTVGGDAGYSQVAFAAGASGGNTVQLRGRAAYQASPRTFVALVAQADRATFGTAKPVTVGTGTLEWIRMALPRNTRLRLSAGATVLKAAPGGPVVVRPAGGAELGGRLARGTWEVHYSRAASPAQGLGRVLVNDQLGGSYSRVLPGRVRAVAGFDRATVRGPLGGGQLASDVARAELLRALPANFWVSAGGSQFTRAQGGAVRSRDLTLRLGYTRPLGGGRTVMVTGPTPDNP